MSEGTRHWCRRDASTGDSGHLPTTAPCREREVLKLYTAVIALKIPLSEHEIALSHSQTGQMRRRREESSQSWFQTTSGMEQRHGMQLTTHHVCVPLSCNVRMQFLVGSSHFWHQTCYISSSTHNTCTLHRQCFTGSFSRHTARYIDNASLAVLAGTLHAT